MRSAEVTTADNGNLTAFNSRLKIDPRDPNGHVTFRGYGLYKKVDPSLLDDFYDNGPQQGSVNAELMTRMLFDIDYGIFDHREKSRERPMAAVAMHPAENLIEGSMQYEVIRNFHRFNVHKLFGMTLFDYLELPVNVYHLINDMAQNDAMLKAKDMEALNKEISGEKEK